MYKNLTFLIFLLCCSRINYVVFHKSIYSLGNDNFYALIIEGPRYQEYTCTIDAPSHWETVNKDSRASILKMDPFTQKENEVWVSEILEKYMPHSFSMSPDEKTIAFVVEDTLYIYNVETSQLCSRLFKCKSPSFFPDGERILVEKENSIYIYSLKDKTFTLVINNGKHPRLSRSGKRFVFQRDTKILLYTFKSQKEFVVCDSGVNPNINPKGDKIIFVKVIEKELSNPDYREITYIYKAIITDTLGNILKKFPIKGTYSGVVYRTPYPYFVNDEDFVYLGYKKNYHPLKSIYLQLFQYKEPIIVREDYETYYSNY